MSAQSTLTAAVLAVRAISEALDRQNAAIASALEGWHQQLEDGLVGIGAAIAEHHGNVVQATHTLAGVGWTASPVITAGETLDAYEALKACGSADTWFADFYTKERLRDLEKEIEACPALAPWRLLIHQGLEATRRDHHALAIPALTTVIDGATALATRATSSRIVGFARRYLMGFDSESVAWLAASSLLEFLCKWYWTPVPFAGNPPPHLNRHWVLHGRDYPRRWNPLEAVRLLNVIGTVALLDFEGDDEC